MLKWNKLGIRPVIPDCYNYAGRLPLSQLIVIMLIDKNQKQLGHKSPGYFHFRKKLNNFKCLVNGYESVSVLNA